VALIICPECGKVNVSNVAEACPNCGYGIKAHFERIEQDKIEKEYEALDQNNLNNIKKPERPAVSKGYIALGIVFICSGLLFIFVQEPVGSIGMFLIGVPFLIAANHNYKISNRIYKVALEDYERLKEELECKEKAVINVDTKLTCPGCGSTQIHIDKKNRSLFTGFMTNKVCLICNHKF